MATAPLSERLRIQERILHLLAQETDPIQGLCTSCLANAAAAIDAEYTWCQQEISKLAKEDFRCREDINIFDILDESDSELREQIRQAAAELAMLAQMCDDLNKELDAEAAVVDSLYERQDDLLTDMNILEAHRRDISDSLHAVIELTASGERELRLLHTLDTVPLFYISTDDSKPTINGYRISLYPPSSRSNYADINAGWGLVGLAVSSIINLRFSYDQAALAADMNYKLSPLRNRVILRRIKYITMKNNNETTTFLGPVLSLEGGVSDTYLEAIAALLVLVASIARQLNRPDAVVGIVGRVLETLDKYGADVASSSFGAGFQHHRSKEELFASSVGALELLPHWRYLFSSPESTIKDLLISVQRLL